MRLALLELRFIVAILLSLFALPPTVGAEKLRPRCRRITEYSLYRVCHGRINSEIDIKYKDHLAPRGTEYYIWNIKEEPSTYFVSFHRSALLPCTIIKYNLNESVLCDGQQTVVFKQQLLHCFNFNLQYVDDLVKLCLEREDRLQENLKTLKCLYTALHYTHIPPLLSTGGGKRWQRAGHVWWCVLVWLLQMPMCCAAFAHN